MATQSEYTHVPGQVPDGTKGWRIGWFIEAADAEGMPLKGGESLRWCQCMAAKGGEEATQVAGKEIGRALLRQIEGLLAKGDLAVIP